ncbi:threonine/serine exporter family protein [Paenibacillus filicis]|uniref:Threonine/serine exporter family protein n=1 Tax=Paenibacillus gyeongsangnamensis TaxID=3388067 RepID=A0ABT4Q8V9_9BACL|nr:threonine/serine exporter family protein [Paenibacillus filicis]MCZ8513256.1 threonine/serine exporter family protein [Paenibacillus filicis]
MQAPARSTYEIVDTCLLAGKIMLENGAETYRVEDTMIRIAEAFDISNPQSFVTPTGIIFSIEGTALTTRLVRITERSTDLRKVTIVNDISRRISRGELTAGEAHRLLKKTETDQIGYPFYMKLIAAAVASGCFLIMYDGKWRDFVPAVLTGGVGYYVFSRIQRLVSIKLFSEGLASLVIGLCSCLFVGSGLGQDMDKIIIGSVMPLVPGLLITNAVRDLMAGHFVSGVSKGAEAFLTAFAIGSGVAFVLAVYGGKGFL